MSVTLRAEYRWELTLHDSDGATRETAPFSPFVFQHAIRAARFAAYRQGRTPAYDPRTSDAAIEPRFEPQGDSPRATGFTVRLALPDGASFACDFGRGYFRHQALALQARLLRQERLSAEASCEYAILAWLHEEPHLPPERRLNIAPAENRIVALPGARQSLGPACDWDGPLDDDLPVIVSREVIDEAVAEAAEAPGRECGGLLAGHLRRDASLGQVFVEVTAYLPGRDTAPGDATSVSFTPETFALAHRLIELRGEDERIIGWSHSHHWKFCAECPLPTPTECVDRKILFYSLDDEHLMRTTFDQPYHVGLLVGVEPKLEVALGHPPVRLFGWRNGVISRRGFQVAGGS